MEVIEGSGQIKIVLRWFSRKTITLSILAGVYAYLILSVGLGCFTDPQRDLFLAGLLASITSLLLVFLLVAFWFNRTIITVDRHLIEIKSFPLPFPFRRIIPADDIIDVYARNNLKPNKIFQIRSSEIHALNDKGKLNRVLGFLPDNEKAEMISRELRGLVCKKRRWPFHLTEVGGVAHG
jgi:hypothetical protein